MIRNIVFDMGHVLIYFSPDVFIERLGVQEEDRPLLMREVFRDKEWVQLDRGTLSEEEAVRILCGRLPKRLHEAVGELVCGWWKRPLLPVPGMARLVGELKGLGYGIYLLSNANRQLPRYFSRIPGAEYFDGLLVSADWKMVKPQREIYEKLYEQFHLKPEECFFIDDQPANIEGAYCTGMEGAVFDGDIKRLRRKLKEAGIPVKTQQKIVFLDIDGTLVTMGHMDPPDSAVEAMRRARENGHLLYLCTGRNLAMLSPMLRYEFDGVVASAGGFIRCGDQVIYDCPMEKKLLENTLGALRSHGISCCLECADAAYADGELQRMMERHLSEKASSELLRWREAFEKDMNIRPMEEYQGQPVYKITVTCESKEQMDRAYQEFEQDFELCIQDLEGSGFVNGELVNRRFHKGKAVERVCAYLGIPLEDSMAFGDSMNDLEMIQTAGIGFGMADGNEKVKAAAAEICPPAEEDGIYRMFEKYGLI